MCFDFVRLCNPSGNFLSPYFPVYSVPLWNLMLARKCCRLCIVLLSTKPEENTIEREEDAEYIEINSYLWTKMASNIIGKHNLWSYVHIALPHNAHVQQNMELGEFFKHDNNDNNNKNNNDNDNNRIMTITITIAIIITITTLTIAIIMITTKIIFLMITHDILITNTTRMKHTSHVQLKKIWLCNTQKGSTILESFVSNAFIYSYVTWSTWRL